VKVVYITGCLGFIGGYVTRECLKLGWQVRGIDSMTYASHKELLEEFNDYDNFVFEKKDICDLDWLYDCDYVINIAAETHVDNSIVDSNRFLKSNISGVHNLLKLIRTKENYQMPTLLHFSTDEVYGDILNDSHKETDLLKPSNPYSATKAAADQLVTAWGRTYNLPYVIVRPTNNYGIWQHPEKLIPKACKYLAIEKKIPVHQGGTPIRNWLHASDTATAITTIINAGVKNEIYNICGGFEQDNLTTLKKLIAEYFLHPPFGVEHEKYIDLGHTRPGQDMRYAVNDDKLRHLGWKPKALFHEELKLIVEFYKNNFLW
jgi:dTDP-glucose 4,6-dehydratase